MALERLSSQVEASGMIWWAAAWKADTQAIRVRLGTKSKADWPHKGWIDRSVPRLQAGHMWRNGSRTVAWLAVIPTHLTVPCRSSARPAHFDFMATQLTNTEQSQSATLPPKGETGEAPEGPGTDGNKPLMGNRTGQCDPSAIGNAGGNIFRSIRTGARIV